MVNLFVVEIDFDIFENVIYILPNYFTLMLIKGMPNKLFCQRSVGPSLFKQDFIRLVKDFFDTSMDIRSLLFMYYCSSPKEIQPGSCG
jgi:hypothetical protein